MKKHDALRLMLTGDSLRKLLRDRGTNRNRLAKATGVSAMMLGRWERGTAVPSAEKLLVVAEHLGLLKITGPGAKEKKGGQNG